MSYDTIRYKRLKDAGLCPRCGGERDDPDRVFCTSCRTKSQERKSADYYWYIEHGICPHCKTNNLFGEEHTCIECKAKRNNFKAIYTDRNRAKYNDKARVYNRIAYYKLREEGLCVNCRRSVEEPGKYAKCSWCRAKERQKHAQKMLLIDKKPPQQQIWHEAGLCYLCGEPLFDGHGLCKKHYEIMLERCGRRGKLKREQANRSAVPKV